MLKNIVIKNKGIILFTIGSLLILLSVLLLLYQRIVLMKEKVFSEVSSLIESSEVSDNVNNEDNVDDNVVIDSQIDVETGYIDETIVDDGHDEIEISDEDLNASKDNESKKKYIGYLEIPKISLKYGFVEKNSYYNNVNRNIQIIGISDFPDVSGGNFIIAGHSGTSEVSYFRDLYRLKIGDLAKVTYKNNIYSYKIVSIYKEKRDGAVNIKRDTSKTTLTLITCSFKDRKNQTIYIAELSDVTLGGQ